MWNVFNWLSIIVINVITAHAAQMISPKMFSKVGYSVLCAAWSTFMKSTHCSLQILLDLSICGLNSGLYLDRHCCIYFLPYHCWHEFVTKCNKRTKTFLPILFAQIVGKFCCIRFNGYWVEFYVYFYFKFHEYCCNHVSLKLKHKCDSSI